jgi:hypothetical protein
LTDSPARSDPKRPRPLGIRLDQRVYPAGQCTNGQSVSPLTTRGSIPSSRVRPRFKCVWRPTVPIAGDAARKRHSRAAGRRRR